MQTLRRPRRALLVSFAPNTAAVLAAFDVIEQQPRRIKALQKNAKLFRGLLNEAGVNTLRSELAVLPAICGESVGHRGEPTACPRR